MGMAFGHAFAQTQYKTTFGDNKTVVIWIERNNVMVEGTSGNEVVIEIDEPVKVPETAQGLRRLNVRGLDDNSGLGLSVTPEGSVLKIMEVCNCYAGTYRIKIPFNSNLTMLDQNSWGGKRMVRNIAGEVDVRSEQASIYLEDLANTVKAFTNNGKIEVSLRSLASDKNISLTTNHGTVLVLIPENTKANVDLRGCNGFGDIFTDFELANLQKADDRLSGTLNGGGSKIELRTRYGDIFLRKRKIQ